LLNSPLLDKEHREHSGDATAGAARSWLLMLASSPFRPHLVRPAEPPAASQGPNTQLELNNSCQNHSNTTQILWSRQDLYTSNQISHYYGQPVFQLSTCINKLMGKEEERIAHGKRRRTNSRRIIQEGSIRRDGG
jgi:hypothetical protein